MMKKNIFISLIVAFVAISVSSAQDLDKILDKHFETIGQKKLLKVKTMQATGKAVMMGMDSPFKMISKRPNKIQVTVEFQGAKIIQAYDGETAWMINPLMGSGTEQNTNVATAASKESSGKVIDSTSISWKSAERSN